jgi:hypothetical protein
MFFRGKKIVTMTLPQAATKISVALQGKGDLPADLPAVYAEFYGFNHSS